MRGELDVTCPAATPLDGPPAVGPSVICGVMANDFDLVDSILGGDERGIHLTLKSDPATVTYFCCGRGIPVLAEGVTDYRDHYTNCPVWQAEKARLAGHTDQLVPERVRPDLAAPDPALDVGEMAPTGQEIEWMVGD